MQSVTGFGQRIRTPTPSHRTTLSLDAPIHIPLFQLRLMVTSTDLKIILIGLHAFDLTPFTAISVLEVPVFLEEWNYLKVVCERTLSFQRLAIDPLIRYGDFLMP